MKATVKNAQSVFNKAMLRKFKDKPCYTCLCDDHGQQFNCGHYIPVLYSQSLRFCTQNVRKQCVRCNFTLEGNRLIYRRNMIDEIGIEKLTAMEEYAIANQKAYFTPKKLSNIIEYYSNEYI